MDWSGLVWKYLGAFLQMECENWRVCEMGVDETVSRRVEVAGRTGMHIGFFVE